MNRSQIIDAISDQTSSSKKDVAAFLDAQDKLIAETLKKNDEFTLGKSGRIEPKHQAARIGRNPATGESLEIAAKTSAKFKPSKDLLTALA